MENIQQMIDLKFGEMRQRYTGKMTFAVLDDLCALHDDLSNEDRRYFWQALDARRDEEFWSWFVDEFSRCRRRM